ncbi:lysophospholipid acyltransferase family protein [Uliginosibacterium sp. H3]|uniref:Lysophospholipid acyltransferase family protein n=1 Tax=Uliginosibacterium silvisoli TaxID=3114758 RepID=A0ABU6K2D9_9RHOO|nr:lysophospholipid acyltransferase family protein [Uliginosibacterium sp. H3]
MSRLFLHLLKGLAIMRFLAPRMSTARLGTFKQRWSEQMLRMLGVRLLTPRLDLPARALIVSNHISWLDIFVINAVTQTHFVCKDDIRKWPWIGWLVASTGTIFIARSNRKDAARTARALSDRLLQDERVTFFPEGTTTNGSELLPFTAALFDAASPAQADVVPMSLRYLDEQGQRSLAPAYDGDVSFMECLRAIVKAPGVWAELRALTPLPAGLNRREYAAMTREQIARDLGMP